MKRVVFFLLSLLCLVSELCAQRAATLTFNIKGALPNDTLVLQWGANNKSMNPAIQQRAVSDVTPCSIPLAEPRLIVVALKGTGCSYELVAQPDEQITVSARINRTTKHKNPLVTFRSIKVSGAAQNETYHQVLESYKFFCDSLDQEVYNDYKDVAQLIEQAKREKDEQTIADMYGTIHGQRYVDRVMSAYQEREYYMQSIVSQHKDSFFGPLLLLKLVGRLDKKYQPLYAKFSPEAKTCYYGREVKDEVDPPTLKNELAPAITVQDTLGNEQLISFPGGAARYLLLDFWASWCQPCHNEIPNLRRIYERYHDRGLELIGISADHNAEDWLESLQELNEPWANYLDIKRQAISEYKVQYIPSIFIIDSEGRIVAEKLRGKDLSDFIDQLFNNIE